MKYITFKGSDKQEDIKKKVLGLLKDLPSGMWTIRLEKGVITEPQFKALHVYCGKRAKQMKKAGVTKKAVFLALKKEMPWCLDSVKDEIWRVFQQHLGLPKSTTKLKTNQTQEIFELCTQFFGEKLNLPFIEWPNEEDWEKEKAEKNLLNSRP